MTRAGWLMVVVCLAVCDSACDTEETGSPHLLTILPIGELRVAVGASRQLSVVDAETGMELPRQEVVWSTSSPEIASVSAEGALAGVAPGQAEVIAEATGGRGVAPVLCLQRQWRSLALHPARVDMEVGEIVQFRALGDGRVDVTDVGIWSWTGGGAVRWLLPGALEATGVGDGAVIADWYGVHAEATVRIVTAGSLSGEEREGPDGTECAGREGTDCCSAEGGCSEGERGAEIVLGPPLEPGEPFVPWTTGDTVLVGTCGQGLVHIWLSLHAPGLDGRYGGTVNVEVEAGDSHLFPTAVFLQLEDGLDRQVQVTLVHSPDLWFGRDVRLRMEIEGEAGAPGQPITVRFESGLARPGRCCLPCAP